MLFDETSWWQLLLWAVLLWIPQNAVHEYSHGLMAKHWKYTIDKVRLIPDLVDIDKDGDIDRVYFAWVATDPPKDREANPTELGSIDIAPQLSNTLILTVLFMLRYVFWPEMPMWLASPVAVWAFHNWVDGSFNMLSVFRKQGSNDTWRYVRRWEIPMTRARIAVAVWVVFWGAALFWGFWELL